MSNQTFTSARAIAVLDQIEDFLDEHGSASSAEVTEHVGLSQMQTAVYLRELEKRQRIQCLERPQNIQCGRTQTIWGSMDADVDGDVEAPGRAGFERQVTVLTSWAPNHVRMPMDCLLFGVPKILQGAHA